MGCFGIGEHQHYSALPWAVPVMAMYLWWYWRYFVQGTGWPRSTAEARAAAAVDGALASFTDSTLPGMVLHTGGNMLSAFDLFARGRSEWQLSVETPPLIWETGADAAFWGNVTALMIVATLTVWAYAWLARVTRTARTSGAA